MWLFILKCIWFFLPAGLANIAAALSKHTDFLNTPIDFGKTLGGKPVFGRNKTWRGFLFGILIGILVFWLQKYLYNLEPIKKISFFDYNQYNFLLGFLFGFGAVFGDLVKSFFKRRFDILPGQSWIPFDQIDYTIGAFLFAGLIYFPGWKIFFYTILIGFLLHMLCNLIAYLLKLQKNKL